LRVAGYELRVAGSIAQNRKAKVSGVSVQVSGVSAAAGLESGQFDRKGN
jgi:hypothetical protein